MILPIICGAILLAIFGYLFYRITKGAGEEEERQRNIEQQLYDATKSIKIKNEHANDSIEMIRERMEKYTRHRS